MTSEHRATLQPLYPKLSPLLPGLPRPAYRYLPGAAPHPDRSPSHVAFSQMEALRNPSLPQPLRNFVHLLAGIDLYHDGFFWEAHEMWETPWLAAKATQDRIQATFFRALIFNTAGVLKHHAHQRKGALRHGQRALDAMSVVVEKHPERYFGLLTTRTLKAMEQFYEGLFQIPHNMDSRALDIRGPRLYHELHAIGG